MQIGFGFVVAIFCTSVFGGCSAVRINSHVSPDGANGYLRTYYSSLKSGGANSTDGTAIEQCKIQGSDVICKDLTVSHAESTPITKRP